MDKGTPDHRFELSREELRATAEHMLLALTESVFRQELDEHGADVEDDSPDLASRAFELPSLIADDVIDFDAAEAHVLAIRFPEISLDDDTPVYSEGYLFTVDREGKEVTGRSDPVQVRFRRAESRTAVEGLDGLSDDELRGITQASRNAFLGTNRLDQAARLAMLEENLDWLSLAEAHANRETTLLQGVTRLMDTEEATDMDIERWYIRSKGEPTHVAQVYLDGNELCVHVVDRRNGRQLYIEYRRETEDSPFEPQDGPEIYDSEVAADALLLFTPDGYETTDRGYYDRSGGSEIPEDPDPERVDLEDIREERILHANQPGSRDDGLEDPFA